MNKGLRTNSKKARENVRAYIMEYAPEEITDSRDTFEDVAKALDERFRADKSGEWYRRQPEREVFQDWAQGLACSGLFLFWYYTRSAVDDLGGILEQDEEKRNTYEEDDAARLLTYLIYREITTAAH